MPIRTDVGTVGAITFSESGPYNDVILCLID